MNALDYAVLLVTILAIAGYGMWRTRSRRSLDTYLRGARDTNWFTIGVAVMATQASATTFLSTPGQGYQDGIGFIQNYFGAPLAMIIIAAVFLPIFRRLNVYTAYEYLGQRFDRKTRLLGAGLFLLQRGIAAGITIYAPAIVLSTAMGWPLQLTIIASGLLVLLYTSAGGSEAVALTQKYQFAVIIAGMIAAFIVLVTKLPPGLTLGDAFTVAGGFDKLKAVDTTPSLAPRYTLWSGLIGGLFLALSYFGADQSQVQRYLGGASLRESRLGLMFNAVFKIPMQLFILLLGALIFVFYQFERPPVFFNQTAWHAAALTAPGKFSAIESDYAAAQDEKQQEITRWLAAQHAGDSVASAAARTAARDSQARAEAIRARAKTALREADPRAPTTDTDYVFINFIISHLPHGLIGLLITVFFAATLNSKAAELNALASATTVDLYRHLINPAADDARCVAASRWFTALWGLAAIGFALSITLAENLIQFANIIASIFYPVLLGLFFVAFFLRKAGGTAVFWGAVAAQGVTVAIFFARGTRPDFPFSYLWDNVIGCAACMLFSVIIQAFLPRITQIDADGQTT
ncbi:sodium:solute symporter [Opitutus sp. GAS368]|uniref:sodium:solute symporter n=1 Tax=Opitutus sp. GAS368 TaxID=1882749 RepID=UPI00087B1FE7|nr:sodium:solute symporter [Opitutus sp. GAS368]SDS10063.1 Sodium:solute symporter family protein [Opitutus sp. GAS368]